MKNIGDMMKQVQQMQERMQDMQSRLEEMSIEGRSGGGVVTITLNGKGAMKAIAIDDSLMKAEEKEILEDLILAAHSDARNKMESAVAEKMKEVTGGMPLPPGFEMPF